MTRLPRATGKEVMGALMRKGFSLLYVRGSHHYFQPPEGGRLVTVPVHSGKTLKPKTLKTILKQAGLNVEELLDLL